MQITNSDAIVKDLTFGEDAKNGILSGVDKLTKAVASTLGAGGACVILEDEFGRPVITKDGVTVAKSINLIDPIENIGATLIKEAAEKTVREAGDGTTTATVIAESILNTADKLECKDTPRQIKEDIEKASKDVIKYLEEIAIDVDGDMIDQVATISSNNDAELGGVIGEAFRTVGKNGVVLMEESDGAETTVDFVDGTQVNRGLKSQYFITDNEKGTAELDKPYVLIVDSPIPNIRKIENVLKFIIDNDKSLLIIADVEPQPLSALVMNKSKGYIKVNVIDPPDFGINRRDTMQDLALLTGATVISEEMGDDIDLITVEHLGSCNKSVTDEKSTIITTNNKQVEELEKRLKSIKQIIKKEKNGYKRARLEERLASLSGSVAIVRVGANSVVELKEKKDRVDDSIHATKAAIKEGIVPGGGIALLNASTFIGDKTDGYKILSTAIKSPYYVILKNADMDHFETPIEVGRGYNVINGKDIDMVKGGIIDPLLVTKSALINAISVALTIMSTDCVVNNVREERGGSCER